MSLTEFPAVMADPEVKPAGMSRMRFALAMLILTAVAAGGGAVLGMQTVSIVKNAKVDKKDDTPVVDAAYVGTMSVKELPSIVTNLADREHVMIRLQSSILFDAKAVTNPDALARQIADDILAFLTTVTSSQIEGASGLQHLREDLNDRAKIRSEGRVSELILETLVVQ